MSSATLRNLSRTGAVTSARAELCRVVSRSAFDPIISAELAIVLASFVSALLGLLVAARLRSVENFAGIINVLLFPMLFISGALYPASGLPPLLRWIARVNPVTHMVELVRSALGQPTDLSPPANLLALVSFALITFVLASLLFDPEQRFIGRPAQSRP